MSEEPSARGGMPDWVPDAIRTATRRVTVGVVIGGIALLGTLLLLDRLRDLIFMLLTALFLSFAMEPAVNTMARRGLRRGIGTGLVFLAAVVAFGVLVALVVPAVISGFSQLFQNAPSLVAKLANWLKPLGIDISQQRLVHELQNNSSQIVNRGTDLAGGVFAVTSSVLGGLFRWSAIGLFTFYFVAQGPRLRRAVCSAFPPERQKRVLFIWEQAVDQTGGYFYSRLLLAFVNGVGMFITLLVFHVPFAAPLAIFEGVVAAFVPIVGTYIGGAVPILVGYLTAVSAGSAALIYVVAYQQVENFFLSPRLTARTMSLHPAVAFGAALTGGALGGLLFAFLALPAAGVVQAAVREWGRRYDVVEDGLTSDIRHPDPSDRPGRFRRGRPEPPAPGAGSAGAG